MSISNLFKKKELSEIQELNTSILDLQGKLQSKEWDYDRLQERMQSKENECEQLRNEICLFNNKKDLYSNYEKFANIEAEKNKLLSDIQKNKELFRGN